MSDDESEELLRAALRWIPNNDWPGNPYHKIADYLQRKAGEREARRRFTERMVRDDVVTP